MTMMITRSHMQQASPSTDEPDRLGWGTEAIGQDDLGPTLWQTPAPNGTGGQVVVPGLPGATTTASPLE